MSRYSFSRRGQLLLSQLSNMLYVVRKSMLCQGMIAGIGITNQRHNPLICGHAQTSARTSLSPSRHFRKPSGRHFSFMENCLKKSHNLSNHRIWDDDSTDVCMLMKAHWCICLKNWDYRPRFS